MGLKSLSSHAFGVWAIRSGLTLLLALPFVLAATASADDWPTYRHDNARSGVTAESLPLSLSLQWVFRSPYAPEPAWGDPKPDTDIDSP